MGCGCGGGAKRAAQAPKITPAQNIVSNAGRLHPAAQAIQNIQKLAEERRKIERLRREQLIKQMAKP